MENSLVAKPQLHEWCPGYSFLLKLVVVSSKHVTTVDDFCFVYKTAWLLSPNFHCGWRIDSGWRIKCTCSLVSAHSCLAYKHKWVLFLLCHGCATFTCTRAALTKSENLLRSLCIIFYGSYVFLWCFCMKAKISFKVELINGQSDRELLPHSGKWPIYVLCV